MSNFVVEKRAGVDVLVFANGTCQPASPHESWLYAENKRLQTERDALQARLDELEDDLLDAQGDVASLSVLNDELKAALKKESPQ